MKTSPYPANPAISLIFVNFHSARYLARALEALFRYEKEASFEVIVVNNDPRESRILRYFERTYGIRLIENNENQGFASAANQGAKEARAPLFGFLNPDIFWPRSQLSLVQTFFLNQPESLLGLSLENLSGQEERFRFGQHEVTLWRLVLNHVPRIFRRPKTVFSRGAWVSGGALFVPQKIFSLLGGMDGGYFLYYEDVDFCRRARERGFAVWAHHELSVVHLRGKSQVSHTLQKAFYRASQERFFAKFRPRWELWALRFSHLLLLKKGL